MIEMDLLPPRWADVSEEITDLLADIATKGQRLDKLHQKHVLPGFNDDDAKRAEERQIEKLTQEITKGCHECHRCIQRVEQMVRESKQAGTITNAEETMAKNIQISLATKVQDASANFRKKQSAYLKSTVPGRRVVCRRLKIRAPSLTDIPCRTPWHGGIRTVQSCRKAVISATWLLYRSFIARVRRRQVLLPIYLTGSAAKNASFQRHGDSPT